MSQILNNTDLLTSIKHISKTIVILFARLCVIVSCVVVSIFVSFMCVCVCVCQVIVHEVPGQELEVEVFDKDPDQDDFLGR